MTTQPPYNPEQAYRDARSSVGQVPIDKRRNFIDLGEMSSFLVDACGTCNNRKHCSDYPMMQRQEMVCETEAGRCVLSFPSPRVRRVEDSGLVECRGYNLNQ